ncbi:hypothetical protein P4N68_01635 [Corynebacterium felinum]|uniref:Monovalent cation/H+ antiporter subunit G n=1 Tax=Corynebacterium felinum TaxID=131318 RepID=A0ABU2B6X6_9CORY|nr:MULTISPECIES: hypothetical protein [Corynebacterium]MDF5819781.1 hypothetical protein [Corynebacterium felinum]MDO4761964.1 hypothetical protein [Corynebacterium sp.]MDR7354350.1 hypothetical protein [Corynebacterium felinum]WJY93724.1 hypothetical protein CFELI_00325 [Corynebacterium felinum]
MFYLISAFVALAGIIMVVMGLKNSRTPRISSLFTIGGVLLLIEAAIVAWMITIDATLQNITFVILGMTIIVVAHAFIQAYRATRN